MPGGASGAAAAFAGLTRGIGGLLGINSKVYPFPNIHNGTKERVCR